MRVVTFGELLLRLAAPGNTKLFQKDSLDATFCGGEANVAVSLSIFGVDSVFATKLPDSVIGHVAAHPLGYFKVDTSKVIYGDGRMGLYYLEKGASQRPSKVVCDRAYSSIAFAKGEEFDRSNILNGAGFYWTDINPALLDNLVEICIKACKKAKKKNISISCDLNYRAKLWNSEKEQSAMDNLLPYVDVCICNEEDAERVLGIKNEINDVEAGKLDKMGYVRTAEMICGQYGCKYVATTLRKSYSASRNGWSAILYDAELLAIFFKRI